MADLTFIDWNISEIFEEIKTAYKTQSGDDMQIGSTEFAIASVVAYVLGIAKDKFNSLAKQRFLSTATGEYLDAIAETLGIFGRPKNYKARCVIRVTNEAEAPYGILPGLEVTDGNDHIFKSLYYINIPENGYVDALFESVTSDISNNNLPVGAIKELVDPYIEDLKIYNQTVTLGANPEPFPYTDEGDNLFREYIKETYNGISAAGSFYTYRKLAIESDPRVDDAYVLKSGDTGFVAGTVKVYWTNYGLGGQFDDSTLATISSIDNVIKSTLEQSDQRPINDVIAVPVFAQAARQITSQYAVYYDSRKYEWSFIRDIVLSARSEYCKFLRTHMGAPFSCVEFFEYIRKQDNGDCIKYIAPLGTAPDYVNCQPWQVAIDEYDIAIVDAESIPG